MHFQFSISLQFCVAHCDNVPFLLSPLRDMKTIQFTDLSLKNVNMRCDNNVTIGGFIIGKELFVILMFIRQEIAKYIHQQLDNDFKLETK